MKIGLKKYGRSLLCLLLAASMLMICGCGSSSGSDVPEENQFTWWIMGNDSSGIYYSEYEENVAVRWINQQYWDTENLTLGTAGNGTRMEFTYMVPVSGAESDNFNTMISTGEYPEIIDLNYSTQNPRQLYEDGVLMEITEYVEKYMPNYLALLEQHPELKPFVTYTDEAGEVHYYALFSISDNIIDPWAGYMYRRDWVVKYAEPTSHVWDWESDYVSQNGHPKYTPLSAAVEANDFTGWKVNEVTAFTSSEGDDPTNDYTDNVIFPSGTSDPLTISDWEWMFEAFSKAMEERGFTGTNAYCISLYYMGFFEPGDLNSSFGGGGPMWYIDEDTGKAAFGGDSDSFKAYLECLNTWHNNGWLDSAFETRASDLHWEINTTGFGQGMVGMSYAGIGMLGTTIRATCTYEEDKQDAMMMAACLPINDVYGTEECKYREPYTLYQQNYLGTPTGFTTALEGKDLETLFTMLNWMYSLEGGLVCRVGLNAEQYATVKQDDDLYARLGIDAAYTTSTNEDGLTVYTQTIPDSEDVSCAMRCQRMACNYQINGNADLGYEIDELESQIIQRGVSQWTKYLSTGFILNYDDLMNSEQSATLSKVHTYINDYMGQMVPQMIKNGLGSWDEYVTKLNKYGPSKITDLYNSIIE